MPEPECFKAFDKEVKFLGEGVTVWKLMNIIVAEITGTLFLVFWGCMSIITGLDHLTVCLAFGLAIGSLLQIFMHISFALMNPALAIGAFVYGRINILLMLIYMVAECVGGILGYALLMLITPDNMKVTHCCTIPNDDLNIIQAVATEFILTFLLVLILGGCWDKRNINLHDSIPLKFGLAITGLALAGGKYTGAGMNPARSLGPAIFDGEWKDHWVYWAGPLGGGFCAAAFYRFTFDYHHSNADQKDEV